jgi:hypothetical protein
MERLNKSTVKICAKKLLINAWMDAWNKIIMKICAKNYLLPLLDTHHFSEETAENLARETLKEI